MTELSKYLRKSRCGRAAYGIRKACIASRVGLVRRADLFKILGRRYSKRAIGYAILQLRRMGKPVCYQEAMP